MDEQDLPCASVGNEIPPILTSGNGHYEINFTQIPEDKRQIYTELLLSESAIKWTINDRIYLQFIVQLLRQHNHLQKLDLWLEFALEDLEMEDLIAAIKSNEIIHLGLHKHNIDIDISPIIKTTEQITTLQKLLVQVNPTVREMEALASALKNSHLRAFVANGDVDNPHWDWPLLIESLLANHATIRELDLDRFQYNHDVEHIGKLLRLTKSLEILKLGDLSLTHENIETTLISNLTLIPSLKELTLTFRFDEQFQPFFKALAHDRLKISTLMAYNDGMCKTLSKDTELALYDSLKTNTSLTKMNLLDYRIDECASLADALKHNSTLKILRIECSEEISRFKSLCDVLKSNTTSLTDLYLDCLELTNENFEIIADVIKDNTTLKKLRVSTAQDSNLMAVCEAMHHNKTILRLDLGLWNADDYLCNPNLTLITNMLKINTTLRRLKVICNDAHAMEVLCNELKHNTTICHIQFDYGLKVYHYKLLLELLADNYALTSVKPFSEQMSKVSLLLTRNRRLKSEAQYKVAILSHNVARSHEALITLPRDVWIKIFCHVTHPGMNNFDNLVNGIFNSYTNA